jgi:hypothetical protein
MAFWKTIIDIGHTAFMFPLAAAIAAWLVAGRAWKMALYWCVLFAGGVSLVALSKIAYLGWHTGIPSLGFRALSGHVLCATAVLPVFCFLVLRCTSDASRAAGIVLGLAISAGLGVLIVYFGFHSASEAIASFILGMCISLGYLRRTRTLPAPRANRWSAPLGAMMFALVFVLNRRLSTTNWTMWRCVCPGAIVHSSGPGNSFARHASL